jgi:hypothetical protein
MSPKATEGVAAREALTSSVARVVEPGRTDSPLAASRPSPLEGRDQAQLLADSTSTGFSL